jgi:GNAT superfamily N-acetyltransferase
MAEGAQISVASLGDVAPLIALIQSAYRGADSRRGWTSEDHLLGGQRIDAEMMTRAIADPDQRVLMMIGADGVLLACATVERRGAFGTIGTLSVSPTLQAGGVGKAILAQAERYLQSTWGINRARLSVIAQRAELIAWYERRGYKLTGETAPFPYGDTAFGLPKRDDLYFVIMEKHLRGATEQENVP